MVNRGQDIRFPMPPAAADLCQFFVTICWQTRGLAQRTGHPELLPRMEPISFPGSLIEAPHCLWAHPFICPCHQAPTPWALTTCSPANCLFLRPNGFRMQSFMEVFLQNSCFWPLCSFILSSDSIQVTTILTLGSEDGNHGRDVP